MPDKEVKIDYVDPRDGRKPATMKDSDGVYFTLSDAAYDFFLPWKGNVGQISYTEKQNGQYTNRYPTHWNGMAVPKDGANVRGAASQAPQPAPQQPQTFHQPADKPVPFGYVGTPQGRLRTMPSIKEQYMMKISEAYVAAKSGAPQVDELVIILENAKIAWEQVMEAPKPAAPTMSVRDSQDNMTPPWEPPPPNSPDDYLAGG